jgi:hypothetical protein
MDVNATQVILYVCERKQGELSLHYAQKPVSRTQRRARSEYSYTISI